jgi:F0F1-type ATP synthase membrane subunit c/vacuolar-type H+-ATPase subunit K
MIVWGSGVGVGMGAGVGVVGVGVGVGEVVGAPVQLANPSMSATDKITMALLVIIITLPDSYEWSNFGISPATVLILEGRSCRNHKIRR